MTTIVKVWRAESAMIVSVVVAVAGVVTLPGLWGKVLGALLPLLGGGAVRQTVWAPDTVAAAIEDAIPARPPPPAPPQAPPPAPPADGGPLATI